MPSTSSKPSTPRRPWARSLAWALPGFTGAAMFAAVAALAPALQPPGGAQDIQQVGPGAVDPNGNPLAGDDNGEGVYVRDSTLALEKFSSGQKMERQKEWHKAAEWYQEVLEKYPDRVVPSRTNARQKIDQYTGVVKSVRERLAKWPAEGREVYRARYENTAASMLEAAGPNDLSALHRVFDVYFVTASGKAAGMRLIDLYLERGEFLAAAEVADRLLELYPEDDLLTERHGLLFRAVLAYHFAGDGERADRHLATLRKDGAEAKGTVRGQDVLLLDALQRELQIPAPAVNRSGHADSYRMFGGNEAHSFVPVINRKGGPGVLLHSTALSTPEMPDLAEPQRQALAQLLKRAGEDGTTVGVMPVADRGELYFQDGRRLYAVSLESGVPLPGWGQTYALTNGQYVAPGTWGSARNQQQTVTLTDKSVLAVMAQPDRTALMQGLQVRGESMLVCLDRQTGRQNWAVRLGGLGDEAKEVRQLQITGSPLAVGDSVLVTARSNRQQQFEDCWVLAFDVRSGKFRWSCYVASASNFGAMWGMPAANLTENSSHLSYANGRVYVMTNLGALAAVDAYSGQIVWLNIVPRGRGDLNNPNLQGNPWGLGGRVDTGAYTRKPWAYNPVVVKDGKLFVLPAEGKHLFIFDAGSGAEFKRVRLDHVQNADTLLGVVGDRLVLCGNVNPGQAEKSVVHCINWRKYNEKTFPGPNDEQLFWPASLPAPIRGRGFLTTTSVFIPTRERLFRLDLLGSGGKDRGGRVTDTYPVYGNPPRTWPEGEGPGNLLVTADHVVIAGAGDVDVFTDLAVAKAKLDREVAAAPADPQPRLRYAEIMFVAGDHAAALARLDEAIGLLGGTVDGTKPMRPGASRDRLFNDAMTFARKLRSQSPADERAETRAKAERFFDRAAAAAHGPQQGVQYRLSRARFARANAAGGAEAAAAAVKLYQQILSDAEMRAVPLLDEVTSTPSQAGSIAERNIAQLIAEKGPAVYEPFETAAAEALKAAQAGGAEKVDPDKLLAVAEQYPNASVAAPAMLAAAESYESNGNARRAIPLLRDMYFKFQNSPERPRISESLARNYLGLPDNYLSASKRIEAATARLASGARLAADMKLLKPLKLPDGRTVAAGTTFSDALQSMRQYRAEEAAKGLPDFRLPIPPAPPAEETEEQLVARLALVNDQVPAVITEKVAALVTPLRDYARPDRVVTADATGRLTVWPAGGDKLLATSTALTEVARNTAWVGTNLLAWGPTQLVLIGEDPAKAGEWQAAWKLELKSLQPIEVVRGGGGGGADDAVAGGPQPGQQQAFVGDAQLLIHNRRQFVAQGGVLRQLGPVPVVVVERPPAGGPEQILEVRPVGDRVLVATNTGRLLSADLATGKVSWQTRLNDRALDRIAANEDFTVIRATDDATVRLVALDTFTGQLRGMRTFNARGGTGMIPMNIALSADGTLVYTLPDRLCLQDLYKPWQAQADKEIPSPTPGLAPYMGATGPDQLVIAEGRILALADTGQQGGGTPSMKYVRVHSLETGQPIALQVPGEAGGQVDLILTAGKDVDGWNVWMRVLGPRLYVINEHAVYSYNLDRPGNTWHSEVPVDERTPPQVREVFIGQNHMALLTRMIPAPLAAAGGAQPIVPGAVAGQQPQQLPPAAPAVFQPQAGPNGGADPKNAQYQLLCYGRYPGKPGDTAESGRLDYLPLVSDPSGITAWQPADGGFYFLSGDGKLRMIKGAGK